jgi:threonylcarbamoyladenosine tRNA methylthiotransferase MtaB
MIQFKKVAFYTLGCKLNFSETSTIARLFEDAGFAKVDFEDTPDVYVINTCSVTDNADKKCKQLVKKALKTNPNAFVTIVGCYAQLKPEEIGEIPGVDLVLGANEKFDIISYIENTDKKEEATVAYKNIKETKSFVPAVSFGDRTRSFLKVQDGCDYFCTFCTIPLARGKSRNASIAETIDEAEKIANTDIKEVVLTGVNIGDFGQGEGENFFQLIQALDEVEGIDRYRISSIEPNLLTEEIIDLVAQSKKLMPHFHIPLQSGSDTILEAMHRKYNTELYRNRIAYIRNKIPHAAIGVDVIVGFPEETDDFFEESYAFVNSLDISYLHVFTYSERLNTRAAKSEIQVPIEVRRNRNKRFRILSDKLKRAFYENHLNKEYPVLFEQENDNGFINGYSPNYIRVRIPFEENLQNSIKNVHLNEVHPLLYVNGNICQ